MPLMRGTVEKRRNKSKRGADAGGKRSAAKAKVAAGVVRIPVALDERLTRLARKTGRSKSYYAQKALETFIEDTEDYLLAVASYEASKKTVSLDELRKKYRI
jgi:RHH-type transcriptional regulator, rel operon repressor / antitoxin RelB